MRLIPTFGSPHQASSVTQPGSFGFPWFSMERSCPMETLSINITWFITMAYGRYNYLVGCVWNHGIL